MAPFTASDNLAKTVANAPSIALTATFDRAVAAAMVPRGAADCPMNSNSDIIPKSRSKILCTSSSSSSSSSPEATGSVQSLQARLMAARRKNELLEEIKTGVDSDGYPLCQYRKGFLDHLKPRVILISTLRVSLQQASTILVSFISEQLELDLKRNQKVNHGEITQFDADVEADEWEKIEWQRRWKTFPKKFVIALLKFHSVTLILRSYEYIASKIVDLKQLDKLTMDPFAMSKRLNTKLKHAEKNQLGSEQKSIAIEVSVSITQTALWANFLPFFSDYSLHQGLLCYAYYKYYVFQRRKRLEASADASPSDPDEQELLDEADHRAMIEGRTLLTRDLGLKSTRLGLSRGLGWFGSSVGAGLGSVVWPGWGTIILSAIGDVAAGSVLDDGYHNAQRELLEKQQQQEGSSGGGDNGGESLQLQ